MKDSYNEISKQASGHPQLEEEEKKTELVPRSASKKHTEAQVEKHLKASTSHPTLLEMSSVAVASPTSETTRLNAQPMVKHEESSPEPIDSEDDDMESFYTSLGANSETLQPASSSETQMSSPGQVNLT
ncbi:hypothetical protein SO802_009840 [Lithocarpus litseifolius]|uniref:Uncharacterized protein n=1 Tax=Lithocarpus litseifolius TaxID=425828 RepID=A0AAW2DF62_9ROSI